MDKAFINCRRSRAKAEINTHGGRVTGWHKALPLIYAIAPAGGDLWPVTELTEVSKVGHQKVRTSYINGCTVIWG